jgi:hypothetical protein
MTDAFQIAEDQIRFQATVLPAVRRPSLWRSLLGNKEDKEWRFRKETIMAQPQMAPTTCNQCKAWYNSERELRDHMRTAHRWVGSEQSLLPSSVQEDRAKQGCTTSFLAEQENEMDK